MASQSAAPVAVVGGGLIGISWAALFTAHGRDVALYEPDLSARREIGGRMDALRAQVAALDPGAVGGGRLTLAGSLEEAARGAGWVQENAPEDVTLKRTLYARLEAALPEGVTIASSTSSLVWSELSAGMARPERLITAHPFNPPHLMPLVELYGPDSARLQAAAVFFRGFGRHPICLKREAVGHIANRLSSALWREAVHIAAEGIADVPAIDEALVYGPGLRWSVLGAHLAYHLGGGPGGMARYLEHLGPGQERRWQDLGTPKLDAGTCATLVAGVETEAAGRDIPAIEAARDAALIAAQRALLGRRP